MDDTTEILHWTSRRGRRQCLRLLICRCVGPKSEILRLFVNRAKRTWSVYTSVGDKRFYNRQSTDHRWCGSESVSCVVQITSDLYWLPRWVSRDGCQQTARHPVCHQRVTPMLLSDRPFIRLSPLSLSLFSTSLFQLQVMTAVSLLVTPLKLLLLFLSVCLFVSSCVSVCVWGGWVFFTLILLLMATLRIAIGVKQWYESIRRYHAAN